MSPALDLVHDDVRGEDNALRGRSRARQLAGDGRRQATSVCGGEQLLGARLALVALADADGVRVLELLERTGPGADPTAAASEISFPDDVRVPLDPRHGPTP